MNRKRWSAAWIIALLLTIFLPTFGHAQQPLIQITSPANNGVATEGMTITITVSANGSLQNVSVMTPSPLPDIQGTSTANQFTLTIPTKIAAGLYNLTAIGTNASGDIESAPVAIDIEPQSSPVGITAGPPWMVLNLVGDQMPVRVIGTFSDGSTLDMTASSQTSYTSNNTQVATVNTSGIITAAGPGQTYIMVQSGTTSFVYAVVMVTVPPQPPSGTPPAISSATPNSGIPGSTQVTISGSGFEATQGNGFVQIGTLNGVVSTWSDTQIVATVPTGSGNGVVEVDQNGLYSNDVPFTINAPVIQGISPLQLSPGMQMAITGTGFGATQNGFVATANTNGIVDSWSDTQIVLTIAPGTTAGKVYVNAGGTISNAVPYAMIPPVITSISPTQMTPGTQLTITGTGFGALEGSGFVATANTNANVVSWSDTQIVATIVPGTTGGGLYVQSTNGQSNSVPYTMVPPVISNISPMQVTPGTQVTITGTGFGTIQGSGFVATANTNGNVVSWSDSQIVITIVPGTTAGGLYVQSTNKRSNSVPYTMVAPVISSISPTQVSPGMQMTITGTGFGSIEGSGFVATANTNANVVSWSDTQIVICIVPGTTGGGVYVQSTNGQSNSLQYSMIPPVITSVSPTQIILGVPVTIIGTHFGSIQGSGFVPTANTNANVISWSDNQIVVWLVQGTTAGSLYVQSTNGQSNSIPFTLSSVTLASISITPASASIFQYQTQQFYATGTYSDGSTVDLTSVVNWSSSDQTIATITSGSTNPGLASPAFTNFGTVTITASFAGVTANASLTVQFSS